MSRKISEKTYTDADIRNAIWYLEQGKTKKFICELVLRINYNTKRLDTIIEEFKQKQVTQEKLKEQARSKTLSELEKKDIVNEYLKGESIAAIARNRYLTDPRIRKILIEFNIPLRGRGKNTPGKTEHVVQDLDKIFTKGDKVYWAKRNAFAVIKEVYDEDYVNYLKNIVSEKYIELHPYCNWTDEQKETLIPKLDTTYAVYYILENGEEWKSNALQNKIRQVEDVIEKTGREYYRIWKFDNKTIDSAAVDGEYAVVKRAELFPLEIR